MNESNTIRKTRKSVLTLAALTLAVFPLLASAAVSQEADRRATIFYDNSNQAADSSAWLYARLKSESRKLCGDSNIYLTGSVQRSAGIEECYEGTLAAAVNRLDDPSVNTLHQQEFGKL